MPISAALRHDLEFALALYGVLIDNIPRDHEGLSITDRVQMLEETGECYDGALFRKADLRSGKVSLWEVFPPNPQTLDEQQSLLDLAGELMHREKKLLQQFDGDASSVEERLTTVRSLIAHIDGDAAMPNVSVDDEDLQNIVCLVPLQREAQALVDLRAQLISELVEDLVPPASAIFVRRALDSEASGLRNADVTLAALNVKLANARVVLEQIDKLPLTANYLVGE